MHNKKSPLISVITVCWNNHLGLKKTFESIKKQICQDFEWIVIDGDSSDDTVDFLENLNYPVTYLSESDSGIYDAMNKGFKFVSGKYIVYMNSGDTFFNENTLLFAQQSILNNAYAPDILLFGYKLRLPNGILVTKTPHDINKYIWHGMPTSHQAIFFSKNIVKNHPYDLAYKICGDYFLLAEVSKNNYRAIYCDKPSAVFEVGGSSFVNPWLLMKEAYQIKRDVLKLHMHVRVISFIKSLISIFGLKILSIKF